MKSQTVMKVSSKAVEEVTMTMDELQHIVDIYFEVLVASLTQAIEHKITPEQFYAESEMNARDSLRDKYMLNAAKHLRESCGIDTAQMGISWGVIKELKSV